jgi:predicted membrane protein
MNNKMDRLLASHPSVNYAFSVIKNSWFWPSSMYELVIFGVLVALIILLAMFFHYNSIQKEVKKKSRCYSANSRQSGVYSVTASTSTGAPLYRVSYDMTNKVSNLECACKEGPVVNNFNDISVYNFTSKSSDAVNKYCSCEGDLLTSPSESVYFSGHPDLVRFMTNEDDSFFNP